MQTILHMHVAVTLVLIPIYLTDKCCHFCCVWETLNSKRAKSATCLNHATKDHLTARPKTPSKCIYSLTISRPLNSAVRSSKKHSSLAQSSDTNHKFLSDFNQFKARCNSTDILNNTAVENRANIVTIQQSSQNTFESTNHQHLLDLPQEH